MMRIVLALLLLTVAILLIVAAVVEGSDPMAVEVFDLDLDTTIWGVFVAGIAAGLIALAGLTALRVGIQQTRARRREIKYLRQKVAEQEPAVDRQAEHAAPSG